MSCTVLIVDDDPAILELTAIFLSRNGFTAITSKSAAEALEKFHAAGGSIRLLIADLKLPHSSGFEVARNLRALAPELKVIFASSYSLHDIVQPDSETSNQLPADSRFLPKPFSEAELLAKIAELKLPGASLPAAAAGRPPELSYVTPEVQARLLNMVRDAIVIRSLDGRIRYWSPGAEILYGWSKDEARGCVIHELLHTIFPEPLENIMATLSHTRCWEGQLHQTARNGDIVTSFSRWALLDGNVNQVEIAELNRDISAQKRVEQGFQGINRELHSRIEDLGRAEQMFRSLFEYASDAMLIVDKSGQILLVNAQAEKQFGYMRDDLLGQSVEMLVPERFRDLHATHRAGYARNLRRRLMGDHPRLRGLRSNGEEFPAEIALSPIETAIGILICTSIRETSAPKS